MSARYYDDSMKPEFPSVPASDPSPLELQLQTSINRALMRRLDALEARCATLEKKLKGVAASVPVY